MCAAVTVGDVMTRCPVSVPLDTPVETVVALLTRRRIGAVPVVDRGGRPVGVVSEADLLTRVGAVVQDVMTSPVRIVSPRVPLLTAARLLGEARVRRLFVTEHGVLAGVVSRRDLLSTFTVEDDTLRTRVQQTLPAAERERVRVSVRDGVVLLLGRVEWRSARAEVDACVRDVPGVVDVVDRLDYVFDDRPRGRLVRSGR